MLTVEILLGTKNVVLIRTLKLSFMCVGVFAHRHNWSKDYSVLCFHDSVFLFFPF